jgi:hypothetical protein
METTLYFTSILLTAALTGFLAYYAWRQPPSESVRAYAVLALCECLLAVVEVLSMVSGSQAQALFWFKLRFILVAFLPVVWLAFALEQTGQTGWLSNKLWISALVVPIITQVILWSNSLLGLWVQQEVGFHQSDGLWIADTSARVPGLWFLVHSFYSLILLLAGIGVILLVALLITGYRQEMAIPIQRALDIQARTCMYKPLEIEKLLQVIHEIHLAQAREILESGK